MLIWFWRGRADVADATMNNWRRSGSESESDLNLTFSAVPNAHGCTSKPMPEMNVANWTRCSFINKYIFYYIFQWPLFALRGMFQFDCAVYWPPFFVFVLCCAHREHGQKRASFTYRFLSYLLQKIVNTFEVDKWRRARRSCNVPSRDCGPNHDRPMFAFAFGLLMLNKH